MPVLWPEFSRWHLYAGLLHYQMNISAVQVSVVKDISYSLYHIANTMKK